MSMVTVEMTKDEYRVVLDNERLAKESRINAHKLEYFMAESKRIKEKRAARSAVISEIMVALDGRFKKLNDFKRRHIEALDNEILMNRELRAEIHSLRHKLKEKESSHVKVSLTRWQHLKQFIGGRK